MSTSLRAVSLFLENSRGRKQNKKHPSVTVSVTCERGSLHVTLIVTRTPSCFEFFPTDFRGTERDNAHSLFGVLENVVYEVCVWRMHGYGIFQLLSSTLKHRSAGYNSQFSIKKSKLTRWLSRDREEVSCNTTFELLQISEVSGHWLSRAAVNSVFCEWMVYS